MQNKREKAYSNGFRFKVQKSLIINSTKIALTITLSMLFLSCLTHTNLFLKNISNKIPTIQ